MSRTPNSPTGFSEQLQKGGSHGRGDSSVRKELAHKPESLIPTHIKMVGEVWMFIAPVLGR